MVRVHPPRDVSADEGRFAMLELLNLPWQLAETDQRKTIVCFDEFQDVLLADDRIDGLIRSVIQRHANAAGYIYAGSQPALMRALFADYERPFYGQARPIDVPVLPEEEAAEDVADLLRADGLEPGDAPARILAFSGGHPQRTMLLCHHLRERLLEREDVDDATHGALADALAETSDAHQTLWDATGRPERLVLLALARGEAATGTRWADEHGVARGTLQSALRRLEKDGQHVARVDGRPRLLDPLLGEWLRRRPV